MSEKIGSIINYLIALGLFAFGMIYLTKSSFMPYHSLAVSLEWNEIEQNTQILIIALMRTIAGGFIVSSVTIAFLQYKFSADKLSWIPPLIVFIGIIAYGASIYAQLLVRLKTPGNPPTLMSILGIIFLIAGYILNRKTLHNT